MKLILIGCRRSTIAVIVLMSLAIGATLLAGSALGDADLPPNWHIHDGRTSLGSQHKGIAFFPTMLGISASDYLSDPARCPNATDKAFLPSIGKSQSELLRAGDCFTSAVVIHLRTVREGTSGPEGWSSLTTASEPGWVTYYSVTQN